jgi:hypothetical protein
LLAHVHHRAATGAAHNPYQTHIRCTNLRTLAAYEAVKTVFLHELQDLLNGIGRASNPYGVTTATRIGLIVQGDIGGIHAPGLAHTSLDLVIGLDHLTHVRVLAEQGCQSRSVKTSNA